MIHISNVYTRWDCFGYEMFSGDQSNIEWVHCRELFDSYSRHCDSRVIYYWYGSPEQMRASRAYITLVQNRLRLRGRQRLTFLETDNRNVLGLRLGSFWRGRLRLQFLTATIRVGIAFTGGNNFWRAAKKSDYSYFRQSEVATKEFLRGRTVFTGDRFGGWVDTLGLRNVRKGRQVKVAREILGREKNANRTRAKICHPS